MKPAAARKLGTLTQALLAGILLLYAGDWGLLHWRIARGTAFGTVRVEQYLATPLKANKAEYDYMGTMEQTCAHSLFPQAADMPCWWLERHRTRWQ